MQSWQGPFSLCANAAEGQPVHKAAQANAATAKEHFPFKNFIPTTFLLV
jgi:hypothetical protein